MDIKIEYKIGNRTVSQRKLERHLREAGLKSAKDDIRTKVSRVRCPRHGQAAQVEFVGRAKASTRTCQDACDELMQRVRQALQ